MKEVLITAPFPEQLIEKIKAVSSEITIEQTRFNDGTWPSDKVTTAEIIYAANSAVPTPTQAPNLRWVQTHYAGVNNLINLPLWDSSIDITSASGIHAPNMAQYVMTQILGWAHHIPRWVQHQQSGVWAKNRWDTFVPDELRGHTLGIVGYGSIGREVARLAKAFGLKILVSKRDARHIRDEGYRILSTGDPEGDLPDRIYPGEATHSMLVECDYVVITLPLTEKTRHLFNENMFRDMKDNAFIVNVGRGSLINEQDLVKALKKGWIAGAGLDVFEEEPLPKSSPLWQMDNVILTPHISGFTPHYDERATDLFIENLRRYLTNEPLLNLVNREAGY